MLSSARDDHPICPHCDRALDEQPNKKQYTCGGCKGVLVEEQALIELVGTIVRTPPESLPFEPPKVAEPFWTCPRCAAQMTKHVLFTIQVDRCEAHGVWFDGSELQRVLEQASLADREPIRPSQIVIGSLGTAVFIALQIARFLSI